MVIKQYFIYILTNPNHTVYYTGVTNNLVRRVYEHKQKLIPGFTEKYNVTKLLYYEIFDSIDLAIQREKTIKKLSRVNKEKLILSLNPIQEDLFHNNSINWKGINTE